MGSSLHETCKTGDLDGLGHIDRDVLTELGADPLARARASFPIPDPTKSDIGVG